MRNFNRCKFQIKAFLEKKLCVCVGGGGRKPPTQPLQWQHPRLTLTSFVTYNVLEISTQSVNGLQIYIQSLCVHSFSGQYEL